MKWPWKLYCLLLVVGASAQMLRKVLTDTGGPSSRYAALAAAVALTGVLIAKSEGRALGRRWLWQVLGVGLVLGWLTLASFALYLIAIDVPIGAGLLGLASVAALPGVHQVWVYGWRSPEIWSAPKSSNEGSPPG
ncbi:MAG: hypothetical protein ACYS26_11835 [Planctomycetota bacterium]